MDRGNNRKIIDTYPCPLMLYNKSITIKRVVIPAKTIPAIPDNTLPTLEANLDLTQRKHHLK